MLISIWWAVTIALQKTVSIIPRGWSFKTIVAFNRLIKSDKPFSRIVEFSLIHLRAISLIRRPRSIAFSIEGPSRLKSSRRRLQKCQNYKYVRGNVIYSYLRLDWIRSAWCFDFNPSKNNLKIVFMPVSIIPEKFINFLDSSAIDLSKVLK